MKKPLSLLTATVIAAVNASPAAGPTIPQRPPPETYEKLTEDWPFALATPVAPVAAPVTPWSSNYAVSGIGKQNLDGTEEVYVAIRKKDGTGTFSLFGNKRNDVEDVSVGGIEWSDSIGKSRVTLKRGSEFATIEFDQAALQAPAQQVPAQPVRPGMPNPPGAKQPMIRPLGTGGVPRPTNFPQPVPQSAVVQPGPSNTNISPSNTNISPSNTGPANPAPNNPSKQRVRVIKSTP